MTLLGVLPNIQRGDGAGPAEKWSSKMREMTRKSVVRMAAFGGGAALVLGGAAAWASIPSSNGTIYGCYADSNGATRIIDPGKKKCSGSESPISWSQRGPAGARGPQGYTGKTGKTGAAGKNGAKGAPGTPGTNGLSGYEYVEKPYQDVNLPVNDSFDAECPDGKVPLGGGGTVQLYAPTGFVHLGSAPLYSVPALAFDISTGSWVVWVKQDAVDGATTATIVVRVTCADAPPTPVN